ncbi:hypothetical protein [Streptomyces ramulosus]|uniref:hypothetical protein n=1 Tax=Streptomyces TaxID=1883 RepID=UPI0031E7CB48
MAWRRYTEQERNQIAEEYDEDAAGSRRIADHLASKGHHDAAGIHWSNAQVSKEVAAAARESCDALNEILNG